MRCDGEGVVARGIAASNYTLSFHEPDRVVLGGPLAIYRVSLVVFYFIILDMILYRTL